ncbi:MAG: hypothetical protein U0271_36610 [Polyangiaceae bacterium]
MEPEKSQENEADEAAHEPPESTATKREERVTKKRRRRGKRASAEASAKRSREESALDSAPRETSSEVARSPLPPANPSSVYVALVVAVGSGLALIGAVGGPNLRPYLMIGAGLGGFATGAVAPKPERSVIVAGGLVAIGLALVATRASDLGIALALAGGLGLGGAIHRLGRLGPELET